MKTKHTALFGLGLSCLFMTTANAAVSYGTAGASYSQDFDSLSSTSNAQPTWTNGSTLDSWYWADPDGVSASTYTVINRAGTETGLTNQQDRPLSIGAYDSAERAFGTQTRSDDSDTTADFARFGVQLSNDTGATLNEFTLSFTAEQWRVINGQAADELTFDYQVFSSGGSLTAASGWTGVNDFTFTAPITTTSGSTWLDGNDSANRELFSETITGVNWGAGEELWLRWNDVSTKHAMMGIDDLSFVAAVPEPSTWALVMISLLAVIPFRRRKK